jgi:hypothetical protein
LFETQKVGFEGNYWSRPLGPDEFTVLLWFWWFVAKMYDIVAALTAKAIKLEKFDIAKTVKQEWQL